MDFIVRAADDSHLTFVNEICRRIEEASKAPGAALAMRSPEYITRKINEGKGIIALHKDGRFAGFCYIETWEHGKFIANSGLIVVPEFRKYGLAKAIKKKAFEISRKKFPDARMFGLTTSLAVMKINSDLGYRPVTFSELTSDDAFWKGCQTCPNYDILVRNNRKLCLCTGMLYDPAEEDEKRKQSSGFAKYLKKYEEWLKMKQQMILDKFRRNKFQSAPPARSSEIFIEPRQPNS